MDLELAHPGERTPLAHQAYIPSPATSTGQGAAGKPSYPHTFFQEIVAKSSAFVELGNLACAQRPDMPSGRERGALWGKLWLDSQTQV